MKKLLVAFLVLLPFVVWAQGLGGRNYPDTLISDFFTATSTGFVVSTTSPHPINNVSKTNKFGRNGDIDAGTPEPLWPGGTSTSFASPTSAETLNIVSTSANDVAAVGTGARTVTVFGLDANYDPQQENVGLAGLSSAPTVYSYIRVHRMKVIQVGSGGANAGIITASQSSSGHALSLIPIDYNQSMQATWTVKNGYKGYIVDMEAHLIAGTNADVTVWLRARDPADSDDPGFQVKHEFAIKGGASSWFLRPFRVLKGPFNEKTDIYMNAQTDVNNSVITGGFDLIEIPEDL